MVIWLIGLSGAGKTTLAREVVAQARSQGKRVVLIDGDAIREMFGHDLGYTLEDRRRNADRISQLCKFLQEQNINVVCAILSIFPESREWNRVHIKNYYEVFIEAPLESLIDRDSKGLYKKAQAGEIENVAGMDLPFTPPEKPDLLIQNNQDEKYLLSFAAALAEQLDD